MVTKLQQTNCPAAYTWYTPISQPRSRSQLQRSKRRLSSGVSRHHQKQCRHVPIEITYPGTGNNSQFTFDGLGRTVKIFEESGGSASSTKQFIWCADNRCEERDGSGNLTKQFFTRGQRNGSTNYFYSADHLGSTRELTDSGSAIQGQFAFDPYGRTIKVQGAQSAYGGAAVGAAVGGLGAGAASIAGQMTGHMMSGAGTGSAGAGASSGVINCSPHPCDPPRFLSTFGECTRYCEMNCKPDMLRRAGANAFVDTVTPALTGQEAYRRRAHKYS